MLSISKIKEQGLEVAVYGSEGLKSDDIVSSGAAEGLIVTSVSAGSSSFTSALVSCMLTPFKFVASKNNAAQTRRPAIQE